MRELNNIKRAAEFHTGRVTSLTDSALQLSETQSFGDLKIPTYPKVLLSSVFRPAPEKILNVRLYFYHRFCFQKTFLKRRRNIYFWLLFTLPFRQSIFIFALIPIMTLVSPLSLFLFFFPACFNEAVSTAAILSLRPTQARSFANKFTDL